MKKLHDEIEEVENDEDFLEHQEDGEVSKGVFVFLGILFTLVAGAIFYLFLKNSDTPVVIKKIERAEVKPKEFKREPLKPKKVLPTLPKLPTIEKIEKPVEYIPVISKSVNLQSNIQNESEKETPLKLDNPKIQPIKIKETKKEKREEIKPFTGGISTVAGVHHYDPNLFLSRGTFIPCSMDIRLISMLGGQISCTVAEDIYSANGNVLLLEKGSTAVGTYKKTGLKNGMNRLYAIWEELRTPNNIIISVNSGSSDELGSAGMVGEVDNHWGMRVGGAILVSIIDDTLASAQLNRNADSGIVINNTATSSSRMATMMMERYINIPPTLYKDQGDLINIYVNKDIDFSKVYGLESQ